MATNDPWDAFPDAPSQNRDPWDAFPDAPGQAASGPTRAAHPAASGSGVLRRLIADPAVAVAQGAVDLGESAVGLGSLATGGLVGRGAQALGYDPERARQAIGELYSPEAKQAMGAVESAEGPLGKLEALAKNPSAAALYAVRSTPYLGGSVAAARGAASALARGATQAERAASAASAARTAAGVSEGALTAGNLAEEIRRERPDEPWRMYAGAVPAGIGTGVLGRLGGGLESALAGAAPALGRTIAGRAVRGGLQEGAEEAAQSGQERAWTNVALDRPVMQGVGEEMAVGSVVGGVLGTAVGPFARGSEQPPQQPPPASVTPPATPPAAPSAPGQPGAAAAGTPSRLSVIDLPPPGQVRINQAGLVSAATQDATRPPGRNVPWGQPPAAPPAAPAAPAAPAGPVVSVPGPSSARAHMRATGETVLPDMAAYAARAGVPQDWIDQALALPESQARETLARLIRQRVATAPAPLGRVAGVENLSPGLSPLESLAADREAARQRAALPQIGVEELPVEQAEAQPMPVLDGRASGAQALPGGPEERIDYPFPRADERSPWERRVPLEQIDIRPPWNLGQVQAGGPAETLPAMRGNTLPAAAGPAAPPRQPPPSIPPAPPSLDEILALPTPDTPLTPRTAPQEPAPGGIGVQGPQGAQSALGGQERRRDLATRARIDAMTPEERAIAIEELRLERITDPMTGLLNRVGAEERLRKPFRAVADADSLKWVNDTMGHGSGDALLKAIGTALGESLGFEHAAHVSGDEFVAHGDSEDSLRAGLEQARARLANATITVELPDGQRITKTGLDFSFGIGPDQNAADRALIADKQQREAAGRRASRGQVPPGVAIEAPAGFQDRGREPPAAPGVAQAVTPAVAGAGQRQEGISNAERQPFPAQPDGGMRPRVEATEGQRGEVPPEEGVQGVPGGGHQVPAGPAGQQATPQAQPVARRTRKQAYAEARRIDTQADDLLAAIAKLGGISQEEARAQGIDPAHFRRRGWRVLPVFSKAGDSFDGMAERLSQYGYVAPEGYRSDELAQRLDRALAGRDERSVVGVEARYEQVYAERAQAFEEAPEEALAAEQAIPDLLPSEEYVAGSTDETRVISDVAEELISAGVPEDTIHDLIEQGGRQDLSDADIIRSLYAAAAQPGREGAGRAAPVEGQQGQARGEAAEPGAGKGPLIRYARRRDAGGTQDIFGAPPDAAPGREKPAAPTRTQTDLFGGKTQQEQDLYGARLKKEAALQGENVPVTRGAGDLFRGPIPKQATIDEAAHQAATSPQNGLPQPTEDQKEAGNYQKGHLTVAGLDISIENPAGSKRRPEWPALRDHYGYIRETVGKDKDHLDVFIPEGMTPAQLEAAPVWVVDQKNPDTGRFDEHKVVLGAKDAKEARAIYARNYTRDWKGFDGLRQFTWDEFKAWSANPEATSKRAALSRSERAQTTAPTTPRTTPASPRGAAPQANLEGAVTPAPEEDADDIRATMREWRKNPEDFRLGMEWAERMWALSGDDTVAVFTNHPKNRVMHDQWLKGFRAGWAGEPERPGERSSPEDLGWLAGDSARTLQAEKTARAEAPNRVKLSEIAVSAIEILEPERSSDWHIGDPEVAATIARGLDKETMTLALPQDQAQIGAIADAINQMSNWHDEESRNRQHDSDARGYHRRASTALGNLAARIGRMETATAPGAQTVTPAATPAAPSEPATVIPSQPSAMSWNEARRRLSWQRDWNRARDEPQESTLYLQDYVGGKTEAVLGIRGDETGWRYLEPVETVNALGRKSKGWADGERISAASLAEAEQIAKSTALKRLQAEGRVFQEGAMDNAEDVWLSPEGVTWVEDEVARLNRRARRIKAPPITLKKGENRLRRVISYRWQGTDAVEYRRIPMEEEIPGGWKDTGRVVNETLVTLEGQIPKVAGWSFVATIDHLGGDEGNIVRTAPGEQAPAEYREGPARCDHCHTARDRRQTFILRHDSGTTKQCGRSCLKDFLGVASAESFANQAELIGLMNKLISGAAGRDEGDMSAVRNAGYALEDFLAHVAAEVREVGYTSRKRAMERGESSTSDIAMRRLVKLKAEPGATSNAKLKPTDADYETARAAMEWAEGLAGRAQSDLEHNMATLAKHGSLDSHRHAGLAAWIVGGYLREQGRLAGEKAAAATARVSQYQGRVGERSEFKGLALTDVLTMESQFGTSFLHKFVDAEGNRYTWFASKERLTEGKTYNLKATVKKHDEYKGVKTTQLTRAAATEVASAVEPAIPVTPQPPPPNPETEAMRTVEEAYLRLSGGQWTTRVRLADLRRAIGETLGRQEQNQALIALSTGTNPRGALMPLDDPTDRTADDNAAALRQAGQAFHLLYLDPPPTPTVEEPAPTYNGEPVPPFPPSRVESARSDRIEEYRLNEGYDALPPEIKQVVDRVINATDDPRSLRRRLRDLRGTPWSVQALDGALARAALEETMAGRTPTWRSAMDRAPADFRDDLRERGVEAVFDRLTDTRILGEPDKPRLSVMSSFLNCHPTRGCAEACYATGANYIYDPNILKGELIDLAVRLDPRRAGQLAARQYKAAHPRWGVEALRVFDKGDGADHWVAFIDELNKAGIRAHVFSKRPDFLRQVSDFNLRLLSVDSTRWKEALQWINEFRPAWVYRGKADNKKLIALWKAAPSQARQPMILPIQGAGRETKAGMADWRSLPQEMHRLVCPVDGGKVVKLGTGPGEYNCRRCDKGNGAACYYGDTTEQAKLAANMATRADQVEVDPSTLILEAALRDLEREGRKHLDPERAEQLGSAVRTVVAYARTGSLPGGAGGVDETLRGGEPGSGGGEGTDQGGRGKVPGSGVREGVTTYHLSDVRGGDQGQPTRGDRGRVPGVAEGAARGELEVYSPAGAPPRKLGEVALAAKVRHVKVGTFDTPYPKLNDVYDAAALVRDLGLNAQEHMVAIVADKNGKPLQVLRHTIGGTDSAEVYHGILFGAIHSVPRAAKVWFAHNHPSGSVALSEADHRMSDRLLALFRDTGIEVANFFTITPQGASQDWNGNTFDTSKSYIETRRQWGDKFTRVPVTERQYERVGKLSDRPISNWMEAQEAVERISQGETGVLLLDTHNRPIAWVPFSESEMGTLRVGKVGKGVSLLGQMASQANAAGAVISVPKAMRHTEFTDPVSPTQSAPVRNLVSALTALNVRALDIVYDQGSQAFSAMTGKSAWEIASDRFFARGGAPAGLEAGHAQAIVDRALERLTIKPSVTVVGDYTDARLPERIRADLQRLQEEDPGTSFRAVEMGGRVWVFAQNIRSAAELQTVLLDHEFRHIGLRGLMGDDLNPVLWKAWMGKEHDKIAAFAREQGISTRTDAGKLEAVEEYVVHLAETGQDRGLLSRIYAAIRDWLRRSGWDLQVTDADLREMVRRAGSLMETGRRRVQEGLAKAARPVYYEGLGGTQERATAPLWSRDNEPQLAWFNQQAKARGHKDIDAMFAAQPQEVERLAEEWRREHQDEARYARATRQPPTEAAEINAVRERLQGTDGWMKAPNGKPTLLNERQWLLVRTPSFKRWFGDWENAPGEASRVIDQNGEPQVVYHGTQADFTEFDPAFMYSGEGWSQSGSGFYFTEDRKSASGYAFQKGGEGGQVLPVFLALRNPLEVDFRQGEVKGAKLTLTRRMVRQIILSVPGIRNPDESPLMNWGDLAYEGFDKVLGEAIGGYAGASNIAALRNDFFGRDYAGWLRALSKATGYDSAFSNTPGATHWVAWAPEQIKSAVGNVGTFSPDTADIRYSRRPVSTGDPVLDEAFARAGLAEDNRNAAERSVDSVRDWWQATREDFKDRIAEGAFDRFHGIKAAETRIAGNLPAEQSGYVAARLSTGTSSALFAMLHYGAPRWGQNMLEMVPGSKGLLQILDPVKGDLRNFFGWMVGRRARRLLGEGREHNFTPEQVSRLEALHRPEYDAVAREFDQYKKAVLDMAEQAGLIDATTRPAWDMADWIPFYRVAEGVAKGPGGRKGLSHQTSGIRRLRGGEQALGDPLSNIVQNFAHLLDASLKNHALRQTLTNLLTAPDNGVLVPLPRTEWTRAIVSRADIRRALEEAGTDPDVLDSIPKEAWKGFEQMWAVQPPKGSDVIRVMDAGKAHYFRVLDPLLLRSMTAVNQESLGGVVGLMRAFKRILTATVTATPDFILRNFIRDALHAWTINEHGFRVGIDSLRGAVKTLRESGGLRDMMMGGASFMGGYINAGDPGEVARSVRRALHTKGYGPRRSGVIDSVQGLWERWRGIGDALENANREAVYESTLRATGSKTEAAFQAKDLMDYSMQGNWTLFRFFADVLPFFNARLQGMYKLGRSGAVPLPKLARRAVLARGSMIMLASLALLALNLDEDEYEALEDWDKDTYWHFWLPDGQGGKEHVRLPKPFEVGLLYGTVPERMARSLLGRDDAERSFQRFLWALRDTMAFDPIPQVVRPGMEVWANMDLFTRRPIEGLADEGKLPQARFDERTSDTMRLIGRYASDATGVSPKQMEHLWRGYLGSLGMYALGASDLAVRWAQGAPELPARRVDQIPVVKSFVRESPALGTRYQTELYEAWREVDQLYRTVREYRREDDEAAAAELFKENKEKLEARPALKVATDRLKKIRAEEDQVMRSRKMTPEAKRARLDELTKIRNLTAKETMTKVGERF